MPEFGQNIEFARAAALAAVEALVAPVEAAEVPSPARALIYERKLAQARALQEGGDPRADYGFLDVDAALEGITRDEAAANVIAEFNRLRLIAERLEGFRRRLKRRLTAAATVAEIRAIEGEITAARLQAALSA